MLHPKGLVVLVLLAKATALLIDLPPSKLSHPEFYKSCPIFRNTMSCDFKDSQRAIEINEIRRRKDIGVYNIDNASDLQIKGRICSDVRFKNSTVKLNGASVCPNIKLEFMAKTSVDRLPEDTTNITISNSKMEELISKRLMDAHITDANVQLVNVTSKDLKLFTLENSTVNKLHQIDLPEGSVVTFSSSEVIESKNNPISYNGGDLKVDSNTRIIHLPPPETTVDPLVNPKRSPTTPIYGAVVGEAPTKSPPGLEIAVAILSVMVAVLSLVQLYKFLKRDKKPTVEENFFLEEKHCQTCTRCDKYDIQHANSQRHSY